MTVERFDDADGSMHSLTGAYMTGSLSWEEFEAYETHLETCDACLAEVEEMAPAAEALFSAVRADISPALMSRILAAPEAAKNEVDTVPEPPAPAPAGEPVDHAARQKQGRNLRRLFALAAAFVVIVGGSIILSQTRTQTPAEQVATADDARSIQLAETAEDGSFEVELVTSASSESVAFLDQSFPELASGESYALWRIPAGEGAAPEFLGLIRSSNADRNQQAFIADVGDAAAFAVSIEAAGASPTVPSDRVVFVGALS